MKKFGLVAALVLALLIPGISACSISLPGSLTIGAAAPDFQLQDVSGQNVTLRGHAGKFVVINFWSTACPPCVDEMPYFQALYEQWKTQGIVLLPIDIGEASATVSGFLQGLGLTLPALLDTRGEVAGKYGIQFTPTTLFIDREGKLKSKVVGAFKDKSAIDNHLKSVFY